MVDEDGGGLLIPGRMIRTRVIILHAEAKCANHCKRVRFFEVVDNERERELGDRWRFPGGFYGLGHVRLCQIDGTDDPVRADDQSARRHHVNRSRFSRYPG